MLTLVGGDTQTGPGGSSMREHLERTAAGDERINFRDVVNVISGLVLGQRMADAEYCSKCIGTKTQVCNLS